MADEKAHRHFPCGQSHLILSLIMSNIGISLAKNTSLLLLAQVIRVAAQALFIVLVRRHLGQSAFGHFSVAFVLAKLVTQFAELGFSTTLLRDASHAPQDIQRILSAALGLRTLSSLMVLILLGVLVIVLPYSTEVALATMLFGVSYLVQSFTQLFFAALRSHERVEYEPVSLLVYAAALLGGTGWVIYSGAGLAGIAHITWMAQAAGLLVAAFGVAKVLAGRLVLSFQYARLHQFWRSCLPIGLGTIGYLIYYQSDTILLYFLRGETETGIYNTAYQLLSVVLILPASYFIALVPRLAKALKSDTQEACQLLRFSSEWMLILGVPLSVGTGMAAPQLLALLFPDNAQQSVLPLQILIWMAAFSYWGQSFTHTAILVGGARAYMRLSLLGALINTAANLVAIPRFGYLGACWTTLGTELIINGAFYLYVYRHVCKVPLGSALWRPALASLIMAALLHVLRDFPLAVQIIPAMGIYFAVLYLLKGRIRLSKSRS